MNQGSPEIMKQVFWQETYVDIEITWGRKMKKTVIQFPYPQ